MEAFREAEQYSRGLHFPLGFADVKLVLRVHLGAEHMRTIAPRNVRPCHESWAQEGIIIHGHDKQAKATITPLLHFIILRYVSLVVDAHDKNLQRDKR